jgi:hypothetical protein
VIVTVVPIDPPAGEKFDITGGKTVKSIEEVAVAPFVVTEIFPVDAPVGTATVREVVVAADTTAAVLPNFTTLFVTLKFWPVIITVVPIGPLVGEKLDITGGLRFEIVKSVEEVAVTPPVVTEIFPVVAPVGTATVSVVVVAADTTATTLPNFTALPVS